MNAQLEQMERQIRSRVQALDRKRKSVGPEKNRIPWGKDMIMKATALLFDIIGVVVNFIPYVGGLLVSIINIAGNTLGIFAYLMLGIVPIKGKSGSRSLVVRAICFIFELIPYVNIIPAFSIAVWYTSSVVRKEDKEYNNSVRKALKEIEQEERSIQYDMQRYQNLSQEEIAFETEEQNEFINQAEQDEEDELAA